MASDSRMVFQDEAMRFARAGGDHTASMKTASAAGFGIGGDKNRFVNPRWNLDGPHSDDDEYDDDDDVDDEDEDADENVTVKNGCNSSSSVHSSSEKANGMNRGIMEENENLSEQQQQHQRVSSYENALTVVQPEMYRAQIMNGGDASGSVPKEMRGENVYGFGGSNEAGMSIDPVESLRTHLVDPVSGDLMDDAMILQCGHSFGSGGMQHVFRMKACCKCSRSISEDLVRPNLALRSAVQAFRREEESLSSRAPKRRRDRFEQEKCSYDDPYTMDSRAKGVQFPFIVSDRVIIKGNKRTPQRFVGRVAVVTMQCLNGWYVVKTLDNAESVKLQYRSLAKVSDDYMPSNVIQNKPVTPNWLQHQTHRTFSTINIDHS